MWIENYSNVGNVRPHHSSAVARPPEVRRNAEVSTDIGGSMPDLQHGGARSTSISARSKSAPPDATEPTRETTTADLAAEPRFAALVDLMERLTGREVMLLPPTTITLGARKQPQGASGSNEQPAAGSVRISDVRPVDGGDAYRVQATATVGTETSKSTQIDVGMEVVQAHAHSGASRSGPVRVHVSAEALESSPSRPLRIQHRGPDAVQVVPEDVSFDR